MAPVIAVAAVISAVAGVVGTIESMNAQKDQAEAQADANKAVAADNADIRREQARRLASTQRAQLAGSGVDLGSGLGTALPTETIAFGEKDALRILKNAQMKNDLLLSTANDSIIGTGIAGIGQLGKDVVSTYNIFSGIPKAPGTAPTATSNNNPNPDPYSGLYKSMFGL